MWLQSLDPNFQNDISLNYIRKGVVGGYKDEMPQEYADRIDKWYAERKNLNQGYNHRD